MKIKCLVLGISKIGKTLLCRKIVGEEISKGYDPTIGIDFHKIFKSCIEIVLYDVSGNDRYKGLIKFFIGESKIMILLFNSANNASIKYITEYINKYTENFDKHFILINTRKNKVIDISSIESLKDVSNSTYFQIDLSKSDATDILTSIVEITNEIEKNKPNIKLPPNIQREKCKLM